MAWLYRCPFQELVFGITPSEGIEIKFIPQDYEELAYSIKSLPVDPFGLILTTEIQYTLPASFQLGGLMAIASLSRAHQYLEHGDYRLLKRAKISLLDYFSSNVAKTIGDYDVFRKSRLYSNGDTGLITAS